MTEAEVSKAVARLTEILQPLLALRLNQQNLITLARVLHESAAAYGVAGHWDTAFRNAALATGRATAGEVEIAVFVADTGFLVAERGLQDMLDWAATPEAKDAEFWPVPKRDEKHSRMLSRNSMWLPPHMAPPMAAAMTSQSEARKELIIAIAEELNRAVAKIPMRRAHQAWDEVVRLRRKLAETEAAVSAALKMLGVDVATAEPGSEEHRKAIEAREKADGKLQAALAVFDKLHAELSIDFDPRHKADTLRWICSRLDGEVVLVTATMGTGKTVTLGELLRKGFITLDEIFAFVPDADKLRVDFTFANHMMTQQEAERWGPDWFGHNWTGGVAGVWRGPEQLWLDGVTPMHDGGGDVENILLARKLNIGVRQLCSCCGSPLTSPDEEEIQWPTSPSPRVAYRNPEGGDTARPTGGNTEPTAEAEPEAEPEASTEQGAAEPDKQEAGRCSNPYCRQKGDLQYMMRAGAQSLEMTPKQRAFYDVKVVDDLPAKNCVHGDVYLFSSLRKVDRKTVPDDAGRLQAAINEMLQQDSKEMDFDAFLGGIALAQEFLRMLERLALTKRDGEIITIHDRLEMLSPDYLDGIENGSKTRPALIHATFVKPGMSQSRRAKDALGRVSGSAHQLKALLLKFKVATRSLMRVKTDDVTASLRGLTSDFGSWLRGLEGLIEILEGFAELDINHVLTVQRSEAADGGKSFGIRVTKPYAAWPLALSNTVLWLNAVDKPELVSMLMKAPVRHIHGSLVEDFDGVRRVGVLAEGAYRGWTPPKEERFDDGSKQLEEDRRQFRNNAATLLRMQRIQAFRYGAAGFVAPKGMVEYMAETHGIRLAHDKKAAHGVAGGGYDGDGDGSRGYEGEDAAGGVSQAGHNSATSPRHSIDERIVMLSAARAVGSNAMERIPAFTDLGRSAVKAKDCEPIAQALADYEITQIDAVFWLKDKMSDPAPRLGRRHDRDGSVVVFPIHYHPDPVVDLVREQEQSAHKANTLMRDRSGSANGRSSLITYNIGRLDDDRHLYDEVISQDEWKKRFPAEGEIMALGLIPLEEEAAVFGAVLGVKERQMRNRMQEGGAAHALWTEAVAALEGEGVHWSAASEWVVTLKNGNQWWRNREARVALEVPAGDVVAACAKLAGLGVPVAKVEPVVTKSTFKCIALHSGGEVVAGGVEGVCSVGVGSAIPPIRDTPMGTIADLLLLNTLLEGVVAKEADLPHQVVSAAEGVLALDKSLIRGTVVEDLVMRGILVPPGEGGMLAISLLSGKPHWMVKQQLAPGTDLRALMEALTSNGDYCLQMLTGTGITRPTRVTVFGTEDDNPEAYDLIEARDLDVRFAKPKRKKKPKEQGAEVA